MDPNVSSPTIKDEDLQLLRRSEIRYRRLFEAARDGILIVDPLTRKITDANPFMSELLGYPLSELLGKELWEIGLLKDELASRSAFQELQRNDYIRYENLPLQNKKGDRHDVEFVSNVYDEDGQKVIQCNIRDITERKRIEDDLRAAKEELAAHVEAVEALVRERTTALRETIGALEAFSYGLSHDMRAPLRAMQGFAQVVIDDYGAKIGEQGVEYLQKISRSAIRLDILILDVLSYAKVGRGELPMQLIDLDRLVRDLIATFPEGRSIQPIIRVKGQLPMAMGNEALLAQCISNLLSNSAKFVAPGIRPLVEVSAEVFADASIRIWVKDNGIGIAPENHDRIFGLFERIQAAEEYEGTGIGLTIVRKAINSMGAQFGFESALGEGSNFWIQLKGENNETSTTG